MRGILQTAVAVGLFCALPALALDGIAVEYGKEGSSESTRITLQWQWQKRWLSGSGRHVRGYWEVSAGRLSHDARAGQNGNITDIGFTPVFRWQRDDLKGFYLEGGIGAHYLSRTSLGDKRLSTQFQFGDHVGFGYRFGAKGALDVGFRYQHLSNGGIKKPNDGLNFQQIRVQYHF